MLYFRYAIELKPHTLLATREKVSRQNLPPYKKLIGDLNGAYLRRLNIKHRLANQVLESRLATEMAGMLVRDNKTPVSPKDMDVRLHRAQLRVENDPIEPAAYNIPCCGVIVRSESVFGRGKNN